MELRAGRHVTLVSDGEKAALAARELGIVGLDAESRRFNAMWRDGAELEIVPGVERVVCAGGGGDPAGAWGENARRMFPGAELEFIGRPSRDLYRGVDAAAEISLRDNATGPVVMHIGAGGEEKRWGMDRWAAVVRGIEARRSDNVPLCHDGIEIIAGEVERERLRPGDRPLFREIGGRFLGSLEELAEVLKGARVFVGCDSGPTHLAAALGVRTVVLFGPTDPAVWGPIGPAVRILAPKRRTGMDWLSAASVLDALGEVLTTPEEQ